MQRQRHDTAARHLVGLLGALTIVSATVGDAGARLAPEYYEQARQDAAAVLTVRVSAVEVPSDTPGQCRVAGEVEDVERDAGGRLQPNAPIAFDVACAREDDEVPNGGVVWTPVSRLERASLMRVWLDPDGDGWRVVRSQSEILAMERTPAGRFPWTLVVLLGGAVLFATAATVWARTRRRR